MLTSSDYGNNSEILALTGADNKESIHDFPISGRPVLLPFHIGDRLVCPVKVVGSELML